MPAMLATRFATAAAVGLVALPAVAFAQQGAAAPKAAPTSPPMTTPAPTAPALTTPALTTPAARAPAAMAPHRVAMRQQQHMAAARTAKAELQFAIDDLSDNRLVAARLALGHAEVALLNDHELALVSPGEEQRAAAYQGVLDRVVAARTAVMRRDRPTAEARTGEAARALQAIPTS